MSRRNRLLPTRKRRIRLPEIGDLQFKAEHNLETPNYLNIWPCSGIQDATGTLKPEMAAIGLPEPGFSISLTLGALALGVNWRTLAPIKK